MNYDKFAIMWKDEVVAHVTMSPTEFSVVRNSESHKKLFNKEHDSDITRREVYEFLADQIFDESNARKDEILKMLGLETYDVWEIAIVTRCISSRNHMWIKFEGDDLLYERDIKTGAFLSK